MRSLISLAIMLAGCFQNTTPIGPEDSGLPVDGGSPGATLYESIVEPCDKQITHDGSTHIYALHAYPMRSAEELRSTITGFLNIDNAGIAPNLIGYPTMGALAYFKDDEAAVWCGLSNAMYGTEALFVRRIDLP